ncbi:hypothetical protein DFS33DRAFT_1278020 [Desarmillaria ectypa]|nr:hypothetical protein DFS33DRAFT_1278020 [Desarmillaria ectypa]
MLKLIWWPFIIVYASSIVFGQLAVDTPYTITKGETTTLSWSGGSGGIVAGDNSSASPLAKLGSTSERTLQYQWPFSSIENGTRVSIVVHDANGEAAQSAPIPVIV